MGLPQQIGHVHVHGWYLAVESSLVKVVISLMGVSVCMVGIAAIVEIRV